MKDQQHTHRSKTTKLEEIRLLQNAKAVVLDDITFSSVKEIKHFREHGYSTIEDLNRSTLRFSITSRKLFAKMLRLSHDHQFVRRNDFI
jgi:hypothetical protein